METLVNMRLLHDAQYISTNVNAQEYPHLIERYSDIWSDLLQQSILTDTNVYVALGLKGVKAMKKHYKDFVLQNNCRLIDPPDSYKQAELDGLTTVTSIFMPALLPSCAVMYEEGCAYIEGKTISKLICTTSNGYIR